MKLILSLTILLSSIQLVAQTKEFPIGSYCFDDDVCTKVFTDLYIEGIDKGNIYIGDGELKKYMLDAQTKTYYYSENGVKKLQAFFKKGAMGTILTITDLSDGTEVYFDFVGKEEQVEETGSGLYGDAEGGGYEYGIDEEPIMGYYDNEMVDESIVNNPHHIQNEEFFNPKKDPKLPLILEAYDYSSTRRIYDLFETAESIPEEVVGKIIGVFDFMSHTYTSEMCYVIYNETDGTHDCFTGKNKLYAKIRFKEDFHYATFLDIKTKQEIGTMNLITGDAAEFTPPGYLLPGTYTLLDGSNGTLTLEAPNDESENMKMEFSGSPYGSKYQVLTGMESPEYTCFLVDGNTAVYTFTCDKEKSGLINLKDVKTGKIISAKYNFEGE